MHIGFITTEYPHPNYPPSGGIGSFIKTFAHALADRGHKATIFLCVPNSNNFSSKSTKDDWNDGQVRIIEIYGNAGGFLQFINFRKKINRVVRNYIKESNIDVIEAPDFEGLQAFCKFPVPLITRINGSITYFNHLQGFKQNPLVKYLERRSFKNSNGIISASDYAGKVSKKLFKISHFQYEVIYNAVNVQKFEFNQGQASNDHVLYFGTLVRKKGVLDLAHIFNILNKLNPKAKLVIAGRNAMDPINGASTWDLMLNIFTQQAQEQVTYKGIVPYDTIHELIVDASVCVFPSYAEVFPLSWLEAMAMQKPIVASSIGWAKEAIIDQESGFLEHPKNHDSFAKKINQLLKNKTMANRFGANAKERVVKYFDEEKMVTDNINYYNRVISKK